MRQKSVALFSLVVVCLMIISTGPLPSYGQTNPPTTPTARATSTARTTPRTTATTPRTSPTRTVASTRTVTVTATTTIAVVPTPTSEPQDRHFEETGFTVPAVFMRYWQRNGGLPVFGFPISEAKTERSLTDNKDYLVQYFERNRFEYHPEFKDAGNEVLLGLLGAELTRGREFKGVEPFENAEGKVYMEATKHSLSEPFLSYWQKNGGLGIFGYPISEPFEEKNEEDGKTYLVQYFQRNRFEFHPENQPPYDVLLGLLGRDFMEMQSLLLAWGPPIPGGIPVQQPLLKPAKPAAGGKFLKGPTVGDGMVAQLYYQDKPRILNLVNDLRFTWVTQQVEWKETEEPRGGFHWAELDKVVDSVQAANQKLMLSVVKSPTWATGNASNGFPKDPRDLGNFMRSMAERYKGRVQAYAIWNEQNLTGEAGEVNPGRYVELLKEAYTGVKEKDPNAIVLTGAPSPTGINDPLGKRGPGEMGAIPDTLFMEEMYKYNNGEVRKYFDVLGAHPYGFNNPPDTKWPDNPNNAKEFPLDKDGRPNWYNRHNSFYFRRIEEHRAIMEKYGDGQKQLWITEYGWCSDYREDGYGDCRYVTLEEQGEYTVGAIQRAKKYYPWMGVMFLWNLNFSTFQPWYTGPSHFSILNGDWSGKPAYFALRNRPR